MQCASNPSTPRALPTPPSQGFLGDEADSSEAWSDHAQAHEHGLNEHGTTTTRTGTTTPTTADFNAQYSGGAAGSLRGVSDGPWVRPLVVSPAQLQHSPPASHDDMGATAEGGAPPAPQGGPGHQAAGR